MAHQFTNAGGDTLYKNQTLITGYPCTLACWYYIETAPLVDDYETLVGLVDKDGDLFNTTGSLFNLAVVGPTAGFPSSLICSVLNAAGGYAEAQSTTYTVGTWQHACGVFSSATSRACFLNGANKGTSATNVTQSALDRLMISGLTDTTAGDSFDGRLAEVAVWSVALTDAEVLSLGAGALSPLLIRPASLEFYAPLVRETTDAMQSTAWTVGGSSTVIEHPRIRYRHRRHFSTKGSTAPAVTLRSEREPGRGMFRGFAGVR